MSDRMTFGGAGAAVLGTMALLAADTSHAIVDLDAADKSEAAVTYAKELLKASTNHGGVDYYTVTETGSGDDAGLVKARLGVVVAADKNAIVAFTFENLVFLHLSTVPALSIESAGGEQVDDAGQAHWQGGTSGMNTVSYRLSPTVELPADTVLSLDVPSGGVGISASEPVSITMDVVADGVHAGDDRQNWQASYPNAIDAKSPITVTSTPNSVMASVEEGYRKFKAGPGVKSDGLVASLGTFTISMEPYLTPSGGRVTKPGASNATAAGIYNPGHFAPIVPDTPPSASDGTSIAVIKGDFSFASKAIVDSHPTCNNISSFSNLIMDDKMALARQFLIVAEDWYPCIGVSGAAPIPETVPYEVEISFEYVDAVNPDFALATKTVTYGSISRETGTVRIPYLTTDERYNQRIVIVNHGAATPYEMSFTSEEGITARAGMASSGTLPPGTTVLRTRDVVTIEGGPPHRVSGTIGIEAPARSVTVATNQTSRRDGDTDTVVY